MWITSSPTAPPVVLPSRSTRKFSSMIRNTGKSKTLQPQGTRGHRIPGGMAALRRTIHAENNERVIYDDPCHLAHAQQVWNQPKR